MLRGLRILVRLGAVGMALALAYLLFTAVQVWSASRRDEARRADAIIVLGAAQYNGEPSPVLRSRLDHAVKLYRDGYAERIAVTGGRQPGDRFTEATASARYLSKRGVPDEVVLREVAGRSTWQSLANTSAFLRARGMTRVLLVSDPFHAARIDAMARELGLEPYTSPTRTSPIGGVEQVPYMARETVAVAAGRVVGFRRLMRVDRVVDRARTELDQR